MARAAGGGDGLARGRSPGLDRSGAGGPATAAELAFAAPCTRSPDRPNPIGLHPVEVRRRVRNRLRIGPIEAVDGTPVVDIKPVLRAAER